MDLVNEFQVALTANLPHHPDSALTMSFCIAAAISAQRLGSNV
jgi:hypothetical protein